MILFTFCLSASFLCLSVSSERAETEMTKVNGDLCNRETEAFVSYSEWQERSVRVHYSREITQLIALHPGPSGPPAAPALSTTQIQFYLECLSYFQYKHLNCLKSSYIYLSKGSEFKLKTRKNTSNGVKKKTFLTSLTDYFSSFMLHLILIIFSEKMTLYK